MRHVISASLFVLSCALAQPASAQLEDKPVPMDKAPFHIPVFANDYLILLDVNIPPGRNTGYHIHYADSVSVNLTPGSQTNQNYGSSEVNPPGAAGEGEPGRATFTDVTKNGPRTPQGSNVGPPPVPHRLLHPEKSRAERHHGVGPLGRRRLYPDHGQCAPAGLACGP